MVLGYMLDKPRILQIRGKLALLISDTELKMRRTRDKDRFFNDERAHSSRKQQSEMCSHPVTQHKNTLKNKGALGRSRKRVQLTILTFHSQ